MAKLIAASGKSFRVEQDWIDVTTNMPERDPNWRETDSNGHEHRYEDGDYPTLRWAEDEPYWCEQHQEEHEQGHWECRVCGEEVSPGMRMPSPVPKKIPGMRSYFIDDELVDEATFKAAVAEAQLET